MKKELKVFPLDTFPACQYVVTFSRHKDNWVFSRHRDRDTWETQGGHVEAGETALDAAKRELYEESGAKEFTIVPICDYWAGTYAGSAVGRVYFAKVERYEPLPESEIAQTKEFVDLPGKLTYPEITPKLFEFVTSWRKKP